MPTAAEALSKNVRLPDPQGMIARIKRRLKPNCSVAVSPYCETLIAMRMQSVAFLEMEKWLVQRGPEFRIPSATLCRNFKDAKAVIDMPLAEELAEQWGGSFDFNTTRMLAGQILIQRKRVDRMVRNEQKRQEESPNYMDRRIRAEMETLTIMTKNYNQMLKSPVEAARDMEEIEEKASQQEVSLSPEALEAVTGMILSGKIKVGKGE
jgi:hypothetical protein